MVDAIKSYSRDNAENYSYLILTSAWVIQAVGPW